MTVCRLSGNQVHITNNGPILYGSDSCENVYTDINFIRIDPITLQPIYEGYTIACEPRCEEFLGFEGGPFITFGKSVNVEQPAEPNNIERKLNISASSYFNNNKLTVNYISNLETFSTIEIYNISGQLVKTVDFYPSSSNANIEIDLGDLINGSYYLNVIVSGVTIHTNKFIRLK